MRYYGLNRKLRGETILYNYTRSRAKLLSFLPGRTGEFWKKNYQLICRKNRYRRHDNSIPDHGECSIYAIVLTDLIRREDIKDLQKGIRYLIKKRRAKRSLGGLYEGLDEICKKMEQMDASLSTWYNSLDCGEFEFNSHPLKEDIAYFKTKVCNINSGYLALQFTIELTETMSQELSALISANYVDSKGYAFSTLTGKSNKSGAYNNYAIIHYNEDALKADNIYETINILIWKFMEELNSIFPFVLHSRGIMPPRIETYATNIDYRDKNETFWNSFGVSDYQGQFINEKHKMFFESVLSGRYDNRYVLDRLIYIFKDDKFEAGQFVSIKDFINYHLNEYAVEYFKFMFLDILTREAGKKLVLYKHKLDKIKLKKNHLKDLLKLKYYLSLELDDYNRLIRDDIWNRAKNELKDIYEDNDKIAEKASKKIFISYLNFCDSALLESNRLKSDIEVILSEFDEKKNILQNLDDYLNTARSLRLNIVMMVIAAITLIFVVFPERAASVAAIMEIFNSWIRGQIVLLLK